MRSLVCECANSTLMPTGPSLVMKPGTPLPPSSSPHMKAKELLAADWAVQAEPRASENEKEGTS